MLELRSLSKHFGGVVATDAVSLRIAAGETHALIGPNGAGKTTLVAQICGSLSDSGEIHFLGSDVTRVPQHARVKAGLARSYQVTSVFGRFSVLDNLALAVQARRGSSFSFWQPVAAERALFDEALTIAGEIGLVARKDAIAATLSHGEQRALEVGLALATRPKLLLLDEPMAGMGPEESQRMIRLIEGLRSRATLLLVEHDMDAVFRLADRISVLVNGRVIASDAPERIRTNAEVRRAYLGDEVTALMLSIQNLETAYGPSQVLFNVSLEIREGETATLLGRNGMGKTTTVRSIVGLTPARAGRIVFRGRPIERERPDRIARAGIGLVPEGRQIFPNLSVRENLEAFAANRAGRQDPWTPGKVFELFDPLRRRANNMGNQLSGGEQQMLAIGRALVTNPHLLILDEATEGLAPLVREEIWRCLGELRAAGQTLLVIDKYIERLVGLADRHTIIERGHVAWQGSSAELDADRGLWHRYLGV